MKYIFATLVQSNCLDGEQLSTLRTRQQRDVQAAIKTWDLQIFPFLNYPKPTDNCSLYPSDSEEHKQCICDQQNTCTEVLYWYHPDHLGSSTFLSDAAGEPYQFVLYLPFGELFAEQRAAEWSTPYLFNAKELDTETGLYYYGARYYDPRVSMWFGVDPKADKAPEWTPYRYAFNNPVRIIDPDGQFETKFGAWLYKATHGFKGKVHYSESRKEYYVGRQLKSSTDARYEIRWGANSESPGGGLINAVDKIPTLTSTYSSHVVSTVVIPHGDDIGKGMQLIGDLVELGGWATSGFTGGASLGAVGIGKSISLLGMGLENWARFEKYGNTEENIINIGIDVSFEILPSALDIPLRQAGINKETKNLLRGTISGQAKILKEQIKYNNEEKP